MRNADILTNLSNEAHALIERYVIADAQRERLENAVYDAVNKLNVPVDELSHVTGLSPSEIREIASTPRELDLPALMGVA